MPWSEAQEKALQARSEGWKPRPGGPFGNITPKKASQFLKHAKARKDGQDRAIKKGLAL